MSARLLNCSPSTYHKDPCAVPSLSQSIAHTLLSQSPLHAWSEHPRLGNQRKAATKQQDMGTMLHKLVLGKGVDLEVMPFDNFRKKAAQEQRDAAVEAGRIPILERDHTELMGALERIKLNIRAAGVYLDGQSEVPIEWTENGQRGPVLCRGMLDHVWVERGIIYDVKKTESAHPKACGRSIINYGYHIQHAAYSSALAALKPDLEGAIDFVFTFIEVTPPYAVFAARPNGMLRELGDMQWAKAVRVWEECLATESWPGYGVGIGTVEAPAWAFAEEFGAA